MAGLRKFASKDSLVYIFVMYCIVNVNIYLIGKVNELLSIHIIIYSSLLFNRELMLVHTKNGFVIVTNRLLLL